MIAKEDALREAADAAKALIDATQARNQAVIDARDAGCTWRSIALAIGLTELGTRNIYDREADHG